MRCSWVREYRRPESRREDTVSSICRCAEPRQFVVKATGCLRVAGLNALVQRRFAVLAQTVALSKPGRFCSNRSSLKRRRSRRSLSSSSSTHKPDRKNIKPTATGRTAQAHWVGWQSFDGATRSRGSSKRKATAAGSSPLIPRQEIGFRWWRNCPDSPAKFSRPRERFNIRHSAIRPGLWGWIGTGLHFHDRGGFRGRVFFGERAASRAARGRDAPLLETVRRRFRGTSSPSGPSGTSHLAVQSLRPISSARPSWLSAHP
jgi:hypothetical protein